MNTRVNAGISKLVDILGRKERPRINHIPRDVYNTRKEFLLARRNHILNLLQSNHGEKINTIAQSVSVNARPEKLLSKVSLIQGYNLIYNYLLDLYAIVFYLNVLEENVDNSIDYYNVEYAQYDVRANDSDDD